MTTSATMMIQIASSERGAVTDVVPPPASSLPDELEGDPHEEDAADELQERECAAGT